MAILSAEYTVGPPQQDGRCYISETHTDESGAVYEFEYLADLNTIDADAVLAARTARINAEIVAKAAAEAEAVNGSLPLTHLEFMTRFTTAERLAIRAAGKTDPVIEDFLELLKTADYIYPTHAMTQAGLQYMVSQALLTAERAIEVGA